MKTLAQIKRDPRVKSAWSEQGTEDGYWIKLKPGFLSFADPLQPSSTIHEFTMARLNSELASVKASLTPQHPRP